MTNKKRNTNERANHVCMLFKCLPLLRRAHTGTGMLRKGSGSLISWGCVSECGACCYLARKHRPQVNEWLKGSEERALYDSLIGHDGWCTRFDAAKRQCSDYDNRPRFCRVDAASWETASDAGNSGPGAAARLARKACRFWIGLVHGKRSTEMRRYNRSMLALRGPTRVGLR